MTTHHTDPKNTAVAGWAHLRPGWEVTLLPVIDTAEALDGGGRVFARLNYDEALQVADAHNASLPLGEDIEALRRVGLDVGPYFGTPTAETALMHSKRHDQHVADQLDALGWSGCQPVFNAGKHWVAAAPPGRSRLFGWWLNGRWVQPNNIAHNRGHFDDGTTTILVRRCAHHADTEPPPDSGEPYDTDPPPPPPRITSPGERGSAVREWQRYLMSNGYDLPRFGADGDHGAETERATQSYRRDQSDTAASLHAPPTLPTLYPFKQCRHYRRGRGKGDPIWIVIHTSENKPSPAGALSLQRYAATMPDGRVASWHAAVSSGGVAECCRTDDVAFAAPGANARGIQVELYTRTAAAKWGDAYHAAMLDQAAAWCAIQCKRWDIPAAKVGPTELRAGERGFCGHIDVTKAWRRTSHHDPGARFPWDDFLSAVEQHRVAMS